VVGRLLFASDDLDDVLDVLDMVDVVCPGLDGVDRLERLDMLETPPRASTAIVQRGDSRGARERERARDGDDDDDAGALTGPPARMARQSGPPLDDADGLCAHTNIPNVLVVPRAWSWTWDAVRHDRTACVAV
jgi:hypothetical protein